MQLLMKPDGWKREFMRSDAAFQIGKAWINGDGDRPVEIWLRLPELHHVMEFGWQDRARIAAERKLKMGQLSGDLIFLELGEIAAG